MPHVKDITGLFIFRQPLSAANCIKYSGPTLVSISHRIIPSIHSRSTSVGYHRLIALIKAAFIDSSCRQLNWAAATAIGAATAPTAAAVTDICNYPMQLTYVIDLNACLILTVKRNSIFDCIASHLILTFTHPNGFGLFISAYELKSENFKYIVHVYRFIVLGICFNLFKMLIL